MQALAEGRCGLDSHFHGNDVGAQPMSRLLRGCAHVWAREGGHMRPHMRWEVVVADH